MNSQDLTPRYTTGRLHYEMLRSRNQALEEAAQIAYQTCAMTRHVSLGEDVAKSIRNLIREDSKDDS